MWIGVAALAALYIPSTLPTPLYPLYRQQFGFSELIVTAIYASYVIGNLAVLFVFGRLSDQIGRRPTSLAAGGILVLSTLCFLAADSAGWLFAARILNGLAAGLGASALTAWIAELEPHHDRARAAVVASSGNLAGLVIGALIAGALGQWVAWPLDTSYVVFLVLLLIILLLLRSTPEGVRQLVHSAEQLSLRPRLGVPRQIRGAFIAPAAIAFAAFALGGFYAALTPGLLSHSLHISNRALTGGVVAVFFGSGSRRGPDPAPLQSIQHRVGDAGFADRAGVAADRRAARIIGRPAGGSDHGRCGHRHRLSQQPADRQWDRTASATRRGGLDILAGVLYGQRAASDRGGSAGVGGGRLHGAPDVRVPAGCAGTERLRHRLEALAA
jgi:MFS family permease